MRSNLTVTLYHHSLRNHDTNQEIINGIVLNSATKMDYPLLSTEKQLQLELLCRRGLMFNKVK